MSPICKTSFQICLQNFNHASNTQWGEVDNLVFGFLRKDGLPAHIPALPSIFFFFVKLNHLPLYELRFRASECGYSPGFFKSLIQQTSLKFWNDEVIFLRGLDWDYMPQITVDQEIDDFRQPALKNEALAQVFNFCECMGYQLTRDTFMKHRTLFNHG